MPAETVRVGIRLGRWLRLRLWLLAWGCGLAAYLAPRHEDRIFDWMELRSLEMVERDAEVEVV